MIIMMDNQRMDKIGEQKNKLNCVHLFPTPPEPRTNFWIFFVSNLFLNSLPEAKVEMRRIEETISKNF